MSDTDYSYVLHQQGHATTLDVPEEDEGERRVRALRESVYELTGIRPREPEKPRIGFF